MGDWTIIIQGHGQTGNNEDPKDADVLAKKAARELKEAGQVLTKAQFIYGAPRSVLPE